MKYNGERCIHCGADLGDCDCDPTQEGVFRPEHFRWVVRNNGLHFVILEDSMKDLAYVGEFKDEALAQRIALEHNKSNDVKVTHEAMLWIGYWLCLGKYRTVMRRHNGCYRATDQGVNPPQEWNADKLCQLVALMRGVLDSDGEVN